MSGITAVHLGDSGAKVAKLHHGLMFLLQNQSGISDETRAVMKQRLKSDVDAQRYGQATADTVGIFQFQIKNRDKDIPKEVKARFKNIPLLRPDAGTGNGDVDDLTAEALNWLVAEARAHAN